jgi:hypothetical protein
MPRVGALRHLGLPVTNFEGFWRGYCLFHTSFLELSGVCVEVCKFCIYISVSFSRCFYNLTEMESIKGLWTGREQSYIYMKCPFHLPE